MAVKAKRKGKHGAGQFWQGKRGRVHPKSKPIITPAGRFESLALAADHYGVTPGAIWLSIARGRPGYRYAKPQPKQ